MYIFKIQNVNDHMKSIKNITVTFQNYQKNEKNLMHFSFLIHFFLSTKKMKTNEKYLLYSLS